MPGPIETAFVDIIATLKFDGSTTVLTEGIRREVKKAQAEFDKLENVAAETARSITTKLSGVKINVDIRDAIGGVKRLGDAVEATVADLRVLSGKNVDLGTASVKRDIDNLERSFARLSEQFKTIDGDTLTINVSQAEIRVREVSINVQKLINDLNEAARKKVDLNVSPALAALRNVGTRATELLKQIRALGEGTISVNVNELGLDELEAKLRSAAAEISAVSGKPIHIDTKPAVKEVDSLEARTRSFGDTFERVGKRLLAFAVFGGITAGLSQLVSSGIQAAAAIEVVQVSIDRLFVGLAAAGKQVGGTATQFFENLRQLAVKTPFQVTDLGNVATRILQIDTNLNKVADSTGKFNSRADIAIDRLKNVADAGAEIGATADDLNGVVSAIQKIGARSTVTLLGLNQISQRLPNFSRSLQIESIIEQLNKVRPGLNATAADFDDLRKKGLLPVTVAVDGLFEGLKKIPGAAGAAAAQAATLKGVLSNLKDFATVEFAKAFASAGQTISEQLNAAFAKTDVRTPLANAIAGVISAAGVATQNALPSVLEFVTKIADKVADGVTAVGNLVKSFASGFGGGVVSGMVTGLSEVVNLLTAANDLLSHLPAGVSEGIGQFVVLSTVLGQLSAGKINVLGLVGDQIKAIGVAAVQATDGFLTMSAGEEAAAAGALQLRTGLEALASATVILAAITAAFIAVQSFLSQNAKADRWSKEFQESINAATASMKDFQTVTDSTEDFVKKFADESNKIKLGDLSALLDGRTTTQLESNLGLTQANLAKVVDTIAEFGPNSQEAGAQLAKLGVNFDTLKGSLGDKELATTVANLDALSEQFKKGAPAAFNAAVAQDTFNFASDETTKAIVAATNASGDYIFGLRQLQQANDVGAAAEFKNVAAINNVSEARQRALIKDATTTDAAGHVTIDYTKALAGLREELGDVDSAFLDILDKAPAVGTSFKQLTSGVGDARGRLLDFAQAVDTAGLSATELDAIGQKLGTTLTGEELSKALAAISADFKSTLDTVTNSLPQFSDAVTKAFADIKIPDGVTGLEAIQSAFDQFSLDHFIAELEKVVVARGNLVANLNDLADISTEAVRRLFDLKLDPTQLAVVAQHLKEGGQQAVDSFLAPFRESDVLAAGAGQVLVNKLVKAGIDPALLNAIPGLTSSAESAINTALSNVQPDIDKLQALKLTVDPKLRGEIQQDIADLKSAQAELATTSQKATIDTQAAVQQATDAGTQVSAAFNSSISASFTSALNSVGASAADSLGALGSTLSFAALTAGTSIGTDLVTGITDSLAALPSSPLLLGDAGLTGETVGAAFIGGLSLQLVQGVPNAFGDALQKLLDSITAVNTLFHDAGLALSDALVTGAGENIDDGLDQVVGGAVTSLLATLAKKNDAFDNEGVDLGAAFLSGMNEQLAVMSATFETNFDFTLNRLNSLYLERFGKLGELFGVAFKLSLSISFSSVAALLSQELNIALSALAVQIPRARDIGFAIGANIGDGLAQGILSKLGATFEAGGAIVDSAEQGAREHSKAHSPSLLFADLGKDLGDGLALGIRQSTAAAVTAMTSSVSQTADAATSGIGGVGSDTLASNITSVFNVLIARVNAAFELLAGKLGVTEIFAGEPVKRFANGLIATTPTAGIFGERGPEALVPLGDGAAAARILSQLAPFIGSQGRDALIDALGLSGSPGRGGDTSGVTHQHSHEWNVTVPTADPESFARRAAVRLERRIQH